MCDLSSCDLAHGERPEHERGRPNHVRGQIVAGRHRSCHIWVCAQVWVFCLHRVRHAAGRDGEVDQSVCQSCGADLESAGRGEGRAVELGRRHLVGLQRLRTTRQTRRSTGAHSRPVTIRVSRRTHVCACTRPSQLGQLDAECAALRMLGWLAEMAQRAVGRPVGETRDRHGGRAQPRCSALLCSPSPAAWPPCR